MQEVLYRRFRRAAAGDKGFLPLPDIILIDGGKGHVTAARQTLDALRASAAKTSARRAAKNLNERDETNPAENEASSFAAALEEVRIVGMVKDSKHRTRALVVPRDHESGVNDGSEYDELALKNRSELFHLIGRIQEEAHRFAIEYHHQRRDRAMTE
jgi:excinuclease ABC subunit C